MADREGDAASSTATVTCTVCERNGIHRQHRAEEKMFGRGGSFVYRECPACGSLALQDVPALSPYYPSDYYSLARHRDAGPGPAALRRASMTLLLRDRRLAGVLAAVGGALGVRVEPWVQLLAGSGLGLGASVLDVGCGDGHRLRTLRRFGFSRLRGIDPYLGGEDIDAGGIALSRQGLGELEGLFDLIMFHHSFEHMADPPRVLAHVHRLLAPSGMLVIRIPLAGSWAWRTYGANWVQLDAPRHLFVYTSRGLVALASRAGFELRRTMYDSGPFQFWGSELYRRGTSLQDSGSVDGLPPPTVPRQQVERWARQAKRLNAAADGDQAAFLFTRSADDRRVGAP